MKPLPARLLAAASLCAGLGLAAPAASAIEYTLLDLGSLGGSYTRTYATGINASGQVVGYGYQWDTWGSNGVSGVSPTDHYQAFVTGTLGQGLTALGTLAGDSWSQARAINDAGLAVGTSGTTSGTTRAFTSTWVQPVLNPLGTLGGSSSSANAVNASGQVVGVSTDAAGTGRAYITAPEGGAMRALNTTLVGAQPPAYMSATGVNVGGQVVGTYGETSYPPLHGFITGPQGVVLHRLPGREVAPGNDAFAPWMQVAAVNAEGQTVGTYAERGDAFLKDADGTDRVLDFSTAPHYKPGNLGGFGQYGPNTRTQALAVNALGQVAGTIVRNDIPGTNYAFITGEDGSDLVEVNSLSFVNHSGPLGFNFSSATGITDDGDFVVNASNGHAYLITVVPEPATVVLLLGGLVWLAARRRSANVFLCSPRMRRPGAGRPQAVSPHRRCEAGSGRRSVATPVWERASS